MTIAVLRRSVVLAALLTPLACARDSSPVVIATAGPWTELYGAMNKRGLDLALEEINAAGGVGGRRLEVIARDDNADGGKAVAIASEFYANRSVVAVVGHVTSGAMVAAARIYDKGLPAVSTTASSPDLSGISPWVFRVISSDSANGMTIARFADTRGWHRAAILYENTAYGRGLTESFRGAFGGEIVAVDPIPANGDANFEPYVSYLATRSPDVVFVAGTNASGRSILLEAQRQHLASAFIGGDGWSSIVADTAAAEGAFVATPFSAQDPRPAAQRFVKAFREKYHLEPDGNAALAYDATMLVARAIQEAGPSRAAVRRWLTSLGDGSAFAGVTGAIRFRPSGDVVGKGVVITRARHGALLVEHGSDTR
jgi:branched-chain amino acid transport system substrate-binding protein